MSGEIKLQNKILLRFSNGATRLFRNNVGMAWQGRMLKNNRGTVILENARPLHAGLMKGSADLIGWQSVEITHEMVGKRIAIFTSVEVKGKGTRTTPEQIVWRQNVSDAGGNNVIARSLEDVEQMLLL